jgi:predicted transcriptional regulator
MDFMAIISCLENGRTSKMFQRAAILTDFNLSAAADRDRWDRALISVKLPSINLCGV